MTKELSFISQYQSLETFFQFTSGVGCWLIVYILKHKLSGI